MKQLVVLSGKGGTGKTTVAAALAHLASREGRVVLVDADVDAPNLELLLQPRVEIEKPFFAGQKAVIDPQVCDNCGKCTAVCRYHAIARYGQEFRVSSLECEGCASCFYVCPAGAIRMQENLAGCALRSETRFGPLFHARLQPGAENSGKMVSVLRQEAIVLAQERHADWLIIDGAPGIGCPVIAAVTGADMALLVGEPTVSGAHDLPRAMQICNHFGVPTSVCINKADINPDKAREIADYCAQHGTPLVARIPYDEVVVQAMRQGCTVTERGDNAVAVEIHALWSHVTSVLEGR